MLDTKNSRILIISHNALSLHNNNGKTLQNLFIGLDSTSVSQLYFQDEIPESFAFQSFYRIRDLDIALSLLPFRRKNVGTRISPSTPEHVAAKSKTREFFKNLAVDALRKTNIIKHYIRNWLYDSERWHSEDLFNWLSEIRPSSIFFLGGNSTFSFKIARALAERLSLPLDIYITDDYVLNSAPLSRASRTLARNLLAEYKTSFSVARHAFVIGDLMAIEFSKAFNRPFHPLINPVKIPDKLPVRKPTSDQHPLKIVYAGGLHLGRDLQIVQFSKILHSIRRNFGTKIDFLVYSRQIPASKVQALFLETGVNFMGAAESHQLESIFSSCDFLLHVESFDSEYTQLTKLSISTKIPESLASGAVLIAYGPPELASIKIISDNDVGYVIPAPELDAIELKRFYNFLINRNLASSISEAAFNFARQNFSIAEVQSEFYNLLKGSS